MATDQISFYDESLQKKIEGFFISDGREIRVSSVYGLATVPYADLGACIDYDSQVTAVKKLLSAMAREPGSGKFKDLQNQRDGKLQPSESFSMWSSGVGTNP